MGLSVSLSWFLLACFLQIGSLGFSEFRDGTRQSYQVLHAEIFGKTFSPKIWGNGPKIGFFKIYEKIGH